MSLAGEAWPAARRVLGPASAASRTSPGSADDLREDAHLRQPPRALRRADRRVAGGAGKLPAGVHPPGPDQRGRQPEPRAGPLTPATASALARPRCAMVK